MIIDTHLHLIYRNKLSYPWLKQVSELDRDATYDQYHTIAARVGITDALHMEVDVAEHDQVAETDLIKTFMHKPDCLLRGAIASCRPESTNFIDNLEHQLERNEIKGLRRVLHVMEDSLSTTTLFRDNLRRLSGTGLTFDLCVLPAQIPLAIELVDECPDVTFILDHCAVPDIKTQSWSPWSTHLNKIAQRHNVIVKISGVMAYANPNTWTLDDLRPYVEHTIGSFGWDRVVWGSDSPVCTLGGSLETWVAATHALLRGCSKEEKSALLHTNAARLWSL